MNLNQQYENIIRYHLKKVQEITLPDRYEQLQQWQSNRLMQTHQTLYQYDQFRPAMDFFRDDLYGALNFRRRNSQLIRALPIMCTTLPESMLSIVEKASELHALSLELDALLLHILPTDINLQTMNHEQWVSAYQRCNNPLERRHQIDLIEQIGNDLSGIVLKPFIGKLLNWAGLPAKVMGFQDVHQFICDGFYAFTTLETPSDFLTPVITTERELSRRWFSGGTDRHI